MFFFNISLFPVAVTTMSAFEMTDFIFLTSYPSIAACKSTNGINFTTVTIAPAPEKEATVPFPTSPYPATNDSFTCHHNISSPSNSINRTFFTSVFIIKFRFSNRIVYINSWNGKVPFFTLSYKSMNSSCCFFRNPLIPLTSSG